MQSNTLKRHTPNEGSRRVGRGGKRGKTSGRGGKGQTARAGSRLRPEMRDTIKRLPKLRGHGKNRSHTVKSEMARIVPVNLRVLETHVSVGDTVNPAYLVQKGIVNAARGRAPKVKILGVGELTKKITISGCAVSESAKAAVEKAGGTVL